jgi:tRNA (cytidine56-2'-O)-methyltransferase
LTVNVLRLSHRLVRDDRVTTHVALVARAFGADKIYVVGGENHLKESIDRVSDRWGKGFEVELIDNWKTLVNNFKKQGLIIHLTMYGEEVDIIIDKIKTQMKDILIVIGSEKVPREIFDISDYNVSIGNQPHSEIAALAIFLDRLFEGKSLKKLFNDSQINIKPSAKSKDISVIKD